MRPSLVYLMAKFRLSRKDILAAPDLEKREVPVPEWGGDGAFVVVRSGTGDERDAFERSLMVEKREGKKVKKEVSTDRIRTKLLVLSIVDEEGNPEFTEADIEALSKKSAKPLSRLFEVAQELWGLSDNDVEELAKN